VGAEIFRTRPELPWGPIKWVPGFSWG